MRFLVFFCVLALVASAGCLGIFGDGTDTDSDTTRFVPEGADAVVRLNVTVLSEEPTTESLFDALAETESSRRGYPESYDAFLDEVENRTDLDPDGLEEVTAFLGVSDGSSTPDGRYAAVVFRTRWGTDEMIEATPDTVSVEEREYNGAPFYVIDTTSETLPRLYMTKLSEEVYAAGTEAAVRDASDISWDGADSLGGELREELDERRDEKASFAVSASEEVVAAVPNSDLPPEALDGISAVSGSYRTDAENGTVGVSVDILPSERESPESVRETVSGFLSLAGMVAEDKDTAEALDSVEVTTEESAVVLSYEATVEDAAGTLRSLDRRFRLTDRLERSIAAEFDAYAWDETGGDDSDM